MRPKNIDFSRAQVGQYIRVNSDNQVFTEPVQKALPAVAKILEITSSFLIVSFKINGGEIKQLVFPHWENVFVDFLPPDLATPL